MQSREEWKGSKEDTKESISKPIAVKRTLKCSVEITAEHQRGLENSFE